MWSDAAREAAEAARGKNAGEQPTLKQHFEQQRRMFGQFTDKRGAAEAPLRGEASDEAARRALFMGVKSGVVPIHDSMAGAMSRPTSMPSPQNRQPGEGLVKGIQSKGPMKGERSPGQEINRQTVLNARNVMRGVF